MHSVCEENDRLKKLLDPTNERRDYLLGSVGRGRKRCQRCSCKPKHNSTYTEFSSENPYLRITPNLKWKFLFETESISHHPDCYLFAISSSTNVANIGLKRCGALLSGAIEATISITRGAGGYSISTGLRCAYVVPASNPAFKLLYRLHEVYRSYALYGINIKKVKLSLETGIQDLARLFRDGKASPYNVDLDGKTLLHVRLTMFATRSH